MSQSNEKNNKDKIRIVNKKNNLHDKSYKDLFSNKETFLSLIQTFVSNTWGSKLTKENLVLVDKSYVLSDYEELESDIVYKARIGDHEVFFYMLLEFQSYVDYRMPIRLLLYMIEIWREILKNTSEKEFKRKSFRLPAVVPIVVYNGEKNWTVARTLKEVISNSDIFGESILDFRYEFLDVNRFKKDELYENQNIASAIFLLDQSISRIEFYNRLKDIVIEFNKLTVEEKAQLKHWLVNVNSEENNYKENIEKIFSSNKREVEIMTSNISKGLEKLKEEGKIEGKAEGKAELLIKQLNKKFKLLPMEYEKKIKALPEKILDDIATDIFSLEEIDELKKYF
ncbi:Rpn family recombination-promoting nuclease/putative transposase [Clostridium cellulovorans]|uniref:Transposase YhgA family protein n=1 Tax=Clostridium cellulovorans (strain ATCC 35296 / DSM 3052 / OCM 3 / 743B) TaxID=573061 RepID=D9SU39_CLOC7|nr:Rpn family recombination-promoting nuclease/putative transposase [Clostridium cellulovorans]ADL50877.1 transposase YhgA family protein [Clostridium cellulovorans 743B]